MRTFLALWIWMAVVGHAAADELTLVYSVDIGGHVASLSKIRAFAQGVRQGGRPTLLIDGGNALSPVERAFVHPQHGSLSVHLMNRAGYDTWFAGHVDAARDGFSAFGATADFSVLGSNLHRSGSGRPPLHVQPLSIVRAGKARVGLIGLASQIAELTVGDPIAAARYYVPMLAPRCDLVVAITVLTPANVTRLAEVQGLDVILNRLPGETIGRSVGEVFVAQIGGRLAGIDLSYDEGKVTDGSLNAVDLDALEPAVENDLDEWSVTVEGQPVSLDATIGRSSGGFVHSAVGYLIADVLRESAMTDLGLVSVAHVGQGPDDGAITPAELIELYPFDSEVGVATLKGGQVRDLLSLSEIGELMFYPSGAVVVYEQVPQGVGQLVDVLIGGTPVEDRKDYTVAVETKVAIPARVRATGVQVRDALAKAIRTAPSLRGVVDGRIQKR